MPSLSSHSQEIESLRYAQAEKQAEYEEECRRLAGNEQAAKMKLAQLTEEMEAKKKLIEWEREMVRAIQKMILDKYSLCILIREQG